MVLKAALGAGLPLGHAEDLAVAAGYLARGDPGGLAELQVVLRPPHHVPRDFGPVLAVTSVAAAGPGLIDRVRAGQPPVALHQIDGPRLLAALVACTNHRAPVTLHLRQDGRVVVLEPGPPRRSCRGRSGASLTSTRSCGIFCLASPPVPPCHQPPRRANRVLARG